MPNSVDGPAGDRRAEDLTVVELVALLERRVRAQQQSTTAQLAEGAPRAFALSLTALEDARIRYTEGRARQLGVFSPADLDRAPDPARHFRERDERAAIAGGFQPQSTA